MIDYSRWSLQAIFDKVSKHLIKQNSKASINGGCVCYNKKDEKRCAAGCLISLDYYRKNDHMGLYDLRNLTNIGQYGKRKDLLRDLQICHDRFHPNQWKKKLKEIASNYNLKAEL